MSMEASKPALKSLVVSSSFPLQQVVSPFLTLFSAVCSHLRTKQRFGEGKVRHEYLKLAGLALRQERWLRSDGSGAPLARFDHSPVLNCLWE